jgi:hypothetical protein
MSSLKAASVSAQPHRHMPVAPGGHGEEEVLRHRQLEDASSPGDTEPEAPRRQMV